MPLMEVRDLRVEIGKTLVCEDLNVTIEIHERWGILGGNGVGKTTLLKTLAGLRHPSGGHVWLVGSPLADAPRARVARQLGLLPQDHEDAFPSSVLDTALIGRHPHVRGWGWEDEHDLALARAALADVGLAGLEARSVSSLSGGERRRLGIATLLTQDPMIMLLDEPTNHLDVAHQVGLLERLATRVKRNRKAWLMVTHDPNLTARFCDRALLLYGEGNVASGTTTDLLTEEHLGRLYKHPMLRIDGPSGPIFAPA